MEWSVDGKTKLTTFRRVLLTKCQQEFEKNKKDDKEREEMLATIEKADTVREGGRRERGGGREGKGSEGKGSEGGKKLKF